MYLALGVTLGFSAGLSPGPLLALVLAESLAGGWRRGAQVALAPLVTDSLIISLSLLALGSLPARVFALVEVAGGLLLLWYGYGTVRDALARVAAAGAEVAAASRAGRFTPLRRGVMVNLLNAHAYLFWLTAGGTLVTRAAALGWPVATAFLAGFFSVLVGSKVFLAVVAARGRRFLAGTAYRATLVALGLALGGLGARALWSGLSTLA